MSVDVFRLEMEAVHEIPNDKLKKKHENFKNKNELIF
jgi:hypothetical protein